MINLSQLIGGKYFTTLNNQTVNWLLFWGGLPLFYAVHLLKISCRFKPSRTYPLSWALPRTHQHFSIPCALLKRERAKNDSLRPFTLWLNSDVCIYTACAPTRSLLSNSFIRRCSIGLRILMAGMPSCVICYLPNQPERWILAHFRLQRGTKE
jgi:hypothetical protein